MATWWLKACFHCRGDLFKEKDYDDSYVIRCFQCGQRPKHEDEEALLGKARWRQLVRIHLNMDARRKVA